MFFSENIPFSHDSNNGVLQYMVNANLEKNILFKYSSQYPNYPPKNVLSYSESYFDTNTNTSDNANYLIVNLTDRVLFPKGYIIRSVKNSATHYLRSWKLYGSLLGIEWTELHSVNEQDDLKSFEIGRYYIRGGPFKFFKIVQTGPCLGTSNDIKYRLRLSYLDFFGFMTNSNSLGRGRTCKANARSSSFIAFLIILISKS